MRIVSFAVVALLALAAPALGGVRTLAEVHTPDRGDLTRFPVIDAFRGRVVWSDYDASVDAWRLMEHAGGVTRALPVSPRRTPFDVDLGPDGRGGALAVYSRCARAPRFDSPTPQEDRGARRHGCDLYRYSFTSGRETAVASANSRADEYWPSVWGSRIAFVRGYRSRRDPDRTTRPYVYLRALRGDGRSRRLRTPSPVITIRDCGPEACTIERRRLSAMVEGLDLRGRTVAWASPRTKAVAFAHDGGVAYFIDGGPGAEFEPTNQPGGAFALKADDAVAYSRLPRSWLPIGPPRQLRLGREARGRRGGLVEPSCPGVV